jgi:hypothetical protein
VPFVLLVPLLASGRRAFPNADVLLAGLVFLVGLLLAAATAGVSHVWPSLEICSTIVAYLVPIRSAGTAIGRKGGDKAAIAVGTLAAPVQIRTGPRMEGDAMAEQGRKQTKLAGEQYSGRQAREQRGQPKQRGPDEGSQRDGQSDEQSQYNIEQRLAHTPGLEAHGI